MKRKFPYLVLLLSISLFTSSLYATTYSSQSYKQTVTNSIDEMTKIRNQIFTLSTQTAFSPSNSKEQFNTALDLITKDLNALTDSMTNYYATIPNQTVEKRTFLLLFNALNLIQNTLFELNTLSEATSSVEKMLLLENYFRFRVESSDTLDLVTSLLSQI